MFLKYRGDHDPRLNTVDFLDNEQPVGLTDAPGDWIIDDSLNPSYSMQMADKKVRRVEPIAPMFPVHNRRKDTGAQKARSRFQQILDQEMAAGRQFTGYPETEDNPRGVLLNPDYDNYMADRHESGKQKRKLKRSDKMAVIKFRGESRRSRMEIRQKKEGYTIPGTNLEIRGWGRDRNGNSTIQVGTPNERTRSFQTGDVFSGNPPSRDSLELSAADAEKLLDYVRRFAKGMRLKEYNRTNEAFRRSTRGANDDTFKEARHPKALGKTFSQIRDIHDNDNGNWTIVDNDNPRRTIVIAAADRRDAMDRGASELKTTNIRVYKTDKPLPGRADAVYRDFDESRISRMESAGRIFDTVLHGYLVGAFWASSSEDVTDDDDINDLSETSLNRATQDVGEFLKNAKVVIDVDELSEDDLERLGVDFWLTRNGHGAGFWDGDWDRFGDDVGDRLTEIAKAFPEVNLYRGDDDRIYMEGILDKAQGFVKNKFFKNIRGSQAADAQSDDAGMKQLVSAYDALVKKSYGGDYKKLVDFEKKNKEIILRDRENNAAIYPTARVQLFNVAKKSLQNFFQQYPDIIGWKNEDRRDFQEAVESGKKDWDVTVYDANNKVISTLVIKGKSQDDADKEGEDLAAKVKGMKNWEVTAAATAGGDQQQKPQQTQKKTQTPVPAAAPVPQQQQQKPQQQQAPTAANNTNKQKVGGFMKSLGLGDDAIKAVYSDKDGAPREEEYSVGTRMHLMPGQQFPDAMIFEGRRYVPEDGDYHQEAVAAPDEIKEIATHPQKYFRFNGKYLAATKALSDLIGAHLVKTMLVDVNRAHLTLDSSTAEFTKALGYRDVLAESKNNSEESLTYREYARRNGHTDEEIDNMVGGLFDPDSKMGKAVEKTDKYTAYNIDGYTLYSNNSTYDTVEFGDESWNLEY